MNKQTLITVTGIFGTVLLVAVAMLGYAVHTNNKGVSYEERIKTDYSNIDKELQRKYSVFTNMVEAIKSYNKYEGETLTKIIEARKSGDINTGTKMISALVEKYPELRSSEHYKTYMTEISITSNRVANYVETYNKSIQDYNSWSRKFPVNVFYHQQKFDLYKNPNSDKQIDGKLFE